MIKDIQNHDQISNTTNNPIKLVYKAGNRLFCHELATIITSQHQSCMAHNCYMILLMFNCPVNHKHMMAMIIFSQSTRTPALCQVIYWFDISVYVYL